LEEAWWSPWAGGSKEWGGVGDYISVSVDGKVMEMNGGDGCKTMCIYLISMNCKLK
jgi:hypothetical protein